jgi:DNA-binding FrmR family transcriptional regulator
MLDEAHQRELVNRLKRIEGQLGGIRRMIEEPRLCIEILQQLAAAQAALRRVSRSILNYHVSKCVPDGVTHGGAEQRKRLSELVDIFDRFSH